MVSCLVVWFLGSSKTPWRPAVPIPLETASLSLLWAQPLHKKERFFLAHQEIESRTPNPRGTPRRELPKPVFEPLNVCCLLAPFSRLFRVQGFLLHNFLARQGGRVLCSPPRTPTAVMSSSLQAVIAPDTQPICDASRFNPTLPLFVLGCVAALLPPKSEDPTENILLQFSNQGEVVSDLWVTLGQWHWGPSQSASTPLLLDLTFSPASFITKGVFKPFFSCFFWAFFML